MNADQVGGLIRAAMAMFGGWAIAHGFTDASWLVVTGAVVAIVTAMWSWYAHKDVKTP